MYKDLSGEAFLNRLYKDLNQSDIVKHTQKGTKNKNEALKRYMDRLETTHLGLKRKADIERLKALYYKKYIIKKEDIPNISEEAKEIIIKTQKESLDKWIDYLTSDDAKYPMWSKYWAFQGMLKIGTYDEASDTYQKRTKKTITPFIEVNPEIIARCIEMIMQFIKDKSIKEEALHALIENGNFQKLYIILTNMKKEKNLSESSNEEGIWITYHYETEKEASKKIARGEKPEYLKLYESLQGYSTGWCTAGSKETAKEQICGGSGYGGGDFLVYYTKDEKGEYKIPRIAIRMEHEHIGEIRGIAKSQNLEENLEGIVEKKLKEISTLKTKEITKKLKACEHARKLTLLNKKTKNNEPFTIEEIKFIWELEEDIIGFGWSFDERIEKIRKTRDRKKDFSINTKIALAAVQQDGRNLKYINPDIEEYRKIVIVAIKKNPFALQFVPENIEGYKEIALIAIQQSGLALKYVFQKKIDKEIALAAVQQNGLALEYVPKELIDKEIALAAVQQDGYALYYVPKDIEGYKEIAIAAIQQNPYALEFVPEDIEGYEEVLEMAKKIIKEENKEDKHNRH